MYYKGEAFIAAALLLSPHASSEAVHYVVRHLFCQGAEIILKAALLLIDYSKYKPRLQRTFGHNLRKIADEVLVAAKLKPLIVPIAKEIDELNHFYSQHLFRYSGNQDVLIDPRSIPYERVLKRLRACIRLVHQRKSFDFDFMSTIAKPTT